MILIALAAVLAVPLYYMSADWAGWLTLYATFGAVPLLLGFKRRFKLVMAIWGSLVFHHLLAVFNAYIAVLPGAEADAANFHRDASAIAAIGGWDFGLGSRFYSTALSLAYSVGGPSHFFGEQTSVLAFSLSCVILIRMLELLKVERHHLACVLVFGLHPAMAIFTSVTLRESWQILFFMQSVYCLLRYRVSAAPVSLLWGLLGAGLMGCLHNGLIVYALCMVPLALFSRLGIRAKLTLPRLVGIALTGTVAAALAAAFLTGSLPYTPSLSKLSEGEALDYASTYRQRGEKGARAEYGVKLDASSPVAFAMSLPPVYVSYMLAPFPWQIRSGMDLFAALDGWLRMLLLLFALIALESPPPGTPVGIPAFLLVLYGSMSVLWSMGTINYGTAIRHHIVPFWILIVLGLPPLLDRAYRIFRLKLR